MKTVTTSSKTKPLSKKPHLVILFEGSWFFTRDTKDKNQQTILALCPYTNAPDHVAEFGQWKNDDLTMPGGGKPKKIKEGESYRVDVSTDMPKTDTFTSLFDTAHNQHHFVYLRSTKPGSRLTIKSKPLMRRVSIPVPDAIEVAGRLKNGHIKKGNSGITGITHSPSGKQAQAYVAFLFIYEFKSHAAMKVWKDGVSKAVIDTSDPNMPHLIFRVHNATAIDEDQCLRDCSSENSHLVSTFDTMRSMAVLPAKTAGTPYHCRCDIAIYPPQGKGLAFDIGHTGLGKAELGLPSNNPKLSTRDQNGLRLPAKLLNLYIRDLASCATGPQAGGDPP
jgi:hypothetical protein